ncbi:hypothetical protein G6O69_25020 [Pseudenhygromyxa sp. WMMC2535]|uniref:hypothetical protein n=1 Tax=Pseudenhygromyxa sp. WMMC2535 TaxID=2712867 RepID=UPI0015523CB4|nr:hypothetical protein [Pseudenhygromyxa sp. WMMC2535]NVB41126.1 hypothetical protein [Pseudenhygromyxa sp. WMMC2535]
MVLSGLFFAVLWAQPSAPPAAACTEPPADLATWLPDGASSAIGLDVDAFAKTAIGRALLPALRADLQLAEALEIIDDCGLRLERTYALALARDPGDGRAVIVQGRGLGEDETLACLADELRARADGQAPWTRSASTCGDVLEFGDGSRAWIVNPFTLVWARGDTFIAQTDALIAGARAPALPPSLATELARVDRSEQLWLAAALSSEDRRALPEAWSREATSVTLSANFDDGLLARMSFGAADIASLATLRELVIAGLIGLAERLDSYGIEHELRERARVGIVDGFVGAELSLDAGEIDDIRERVGERIIGRGPI